MDEEHQSLVRNEVWELTEAPKDRTIIDYKWTYKLKRDSDGNVQRYKARLVARGFRQREGIDYHETHSPVVRFDSIRIILAIAASGSKTIQQFDVKTAFLYGNIDEAIYMRQPEGYEDGTTRVYKPKRSLYGLKQVSRCWNRRFIDFLQKFNLEATSADPCVFISKEREILLAIYIDDGLIIADNRKQIYQMLGELQKEFEITHGEANMFLGLQIERTLGGNIFFHQ